MLFAKYYMLFRKFLHNLILALAPHSLIYFGNMQMTVNLRFLMLMLSNYDNTQLLYND